jgi:hypothetical protein
MGYLVIIVLTWLILTLILALFKHHEDLVQACQTDEELVALIKGSFLPLFLLTYMTNTTQPMQRSSTHPPPTPPSK